MAEDEMVFTNQQLAGIFDRIAALLEIKGDVIYKIRAYQKAAESLRAFPEDINRVASENRLDDIPGVGKAISEKIQELLATGHLEFLDNLEGEVPTGLVDLLQVPDLGPRKVALFWKQRGITSLPELEMAAREGKLRDLPGMGEKSEARIIAGIEALNRRSDRMSLEVAWAAADRWLEWLRAQEGVVRAEAGGSLRRWRETIGDLDLAVASKAGSGPAILEAFASHPEVAQLLGQGEVKTSVELKNGMRIQVWTARPERFGSLWLYATGSKAHNVRLRELALKKKLSLSDRGMQKEDGSLIEYATEEAVYAELGLPWIPPELREDRGEIEAGFKKRLPQLVRSGDIRADLHVHSNWSDGAVTILEMARAAQKLGYTTLAITDHSPAMGITGGPKPDQLASQRAEIEHAQQAIGDSIRLLHGIEVDIMADGSLFFPDDVLASLDIVIASLHISLRQPRAVVTARLLNAIRNPHVDIIGHASGRLLPNREGADLNWDAVLEAAREHHVALEINASPSRLDVSDVYARRAIEMGIPLAINTDAHAPDQYALMRFGVAVARRAWARPEKIINTWDTDRITAWLRGRGNA